MSIHHCKNECKYHRAVARYTETSGYCKECDMWVLISDQYRRCPCCHYRVRQHSRNKEIRA